MCFFNEISTVASLGKPAPNPHGKPKRNERTPFAKTWQASGSSLGLVGIGVLVLVLFTRLNY